jgi:hypothetical protein
MGVERLVATASRYSSGEEYRAGIDVGTCWYHRYWSFITSRTYEFLPSVCTIGFVPP